MEVVLIKFDYRYDDCVETIGIATNREAADKYVKDLAAKYPHCYGEGYGTWYFEDFDLIEE